ncbi:anthrone oxygenase family protein [Nonomuraea sp. NPDC005650]|uniref:anthrone oxygenase family protein n=1 Tax=Nonomuraea sp. NPDC005650 TaxID=3157045 RepID=UPI0033AC653C
MDLLAAIAAILALVLNGLMAGVYFAFSTSVMPALDAVEKDQAEAVMRSVNRKILNPAFLSTFTLAPLIALVAGILLFVAGPGSLPGILAVAAALVAFFGSIVVTSVVNVPLNNAIDAGELDWAGYSPRWTRFNHVRGWACALAVALLGAALYVWE